MAVRYIRQWSHEHSPLLWVEMIFCGDTKYMPLYTGFMFGGHYFIDQKQKAIFFKNETIAEKAKVIGYKKYRSVNFIKNFLQESINIERKLNSVTKTINQNRLCHLDNKELVKLFDNFFELNSALYGFYRFTRPDFYEEIIKKIESRYPAFQANNFFRGNNGIKINSRDRTILNGLRLIGERRFQMHRIYSDSFSQAKKLFREIAGRIGLGIMEMQNCTSKEIIQILGGETKVNKKEIQHRLNCFKFVYSGADYKLICPYRYKESKSSETKIIKGVTAYGGHVRAKVIVVAESLKGASKEKLKKINKKTVLVTVMTSPDMVPAMKKAAAIITDEGGILCHAAIVSRELKVPCVIGTKIASRILQDNDLVEIDADHGIIKIL